MFDVSHIWVFLWFGITKHLSGAHDALNNGCSFVLPLQFSTMLKFFLCNIQVIITTLTTICRDTNTKSLEGYINIHIYSCTESVNFRLPFILLKMSLCTKITTMLSKGFQIGKDIQNNRHGIYI